MILILADPTWFRLPQLDTHDLLQYPLEGFRPASQLLQSTAEVLSQLTLAAGWSVFGPHARVHMMDLCSLYTLGAGR